MKKIYELFLRPFRFQIFRLILSKPEKENFLFRKITTLFLGFIFLTGLNSNLYADVDLTTSTLAAASINQGTNNDIVYAQYHY